MREMYGLIVCRRQTEDSETYMGRGSDTGMW